MEHVVVFHFEGVGAEQADGRREEMVEGTSGDVGGSESGDGARSHVGDGEAGVVVLRVAQLTHVMKLHPADPAKTCNMPETELWSSQ